MSASVIIPVWGSYMEFLPECLEHLAGEGGVAEIIVVGPHTPIQLPANALHVRAEGGDIGTLREAGRLHAGHPFLCFLDVDDRLAPGAVGQMLRWLDAHPHVDACGGMIMAMQPHGLAPYGWPRRRDLFTSRFPYWLFVRVACANRLSFTGSLWRAEQMQQIAPLPPGNFAEDWHANVRWCAGRSYRLLPFATRHYAVRGGSIYAGRVIPRSAFRALKRSIRADLRAPGTPWRYRAWGWLSVVAHERNTRRSTPGGHKPARQPSV